MSTPPRNRLRARLGAATVALVTSGAIALSAPPAQAASPDLAGLWSFTEGVGQTAFDYSFSGNSGVLGSTHSRDAQDPDRIRTSFMWQPTGLRFDGDDYVRVRNAPSLEPDGVTVVARLRAARSPGAFRYVVSKGALACDSASYGLYTGADGALRFYASDGATVVLSAAAPASLWDGRWHTVVGSFDDGEVRLWVDRTPTGDPVPADLAVGYDLPDGEDLLIGSYDGPCGSEQLGFVGDLDGVALVGSGRGAAASQLVS